MHRGRPRKSPVEISEGATSSEAHYRSHLVPPDPFKIINKQPDRAYRLVSRRLLDKNGGHDDRGWIPITAENSKGESFATATGKAYSGTTLQKDDLVGCFMDASDFDVKQRELEAAQNYLNQSMDASNKIRSLQRDAIIDVHSQKHGISESIEI